MPRYVGLLHFVGQIRKIYQLTLADVATQHGEVALAATIFDDHVVVLACLDVERLVVGTASASEAAEAAATAALVLFYHLTVYFQHVAVVARQRIFHLTRKCGGIFSADADADVVVADTLGKSPGAKSREVQLVVIARLDRSRRFTLEGRRL